MTTPKRQFKIENGPGRFDYGVGCLQRGNLQGEPSFAIFSTEHPGPEGLILIQITGHDLVDGESENARYEKRHFEIRGLGKGFLLAGGPNKWVFVIIGYDLDARRGMLYMVDSLEASISSNRIYQRRRQYEAQDCPHLVYREPIQDAPGQIKLIQCDGDGNPVEQARRLSLTPADFYLIYKLAHYRYQ